MGAAEPEVLLAPLPDEPHTERKTNYYYLNPPRKSNKILASRHPFLTTAYTKLYVSAGNRFKSSVF
jgi:hypothetical protein